jgi:hypothetical protein
MTGPGGGPAGVFLAAAGHDPDRPLIDDLSLSVAPGQTVAIVGLCTKRFRGSALCTLSQAGLATGAEPGPEPGTARDLEVPRSLAP